jgi:hypothetical protein
MLARGTGKGKGRLSIALLRHSHHRAEGHARYSKA